MKVFILNEVEKLTHREHSDGGLVVIAKDAASARALVEGSSAIASAKSRAMGYDDGDGDKRPSVTDAEWANVIVYGLAGSPKPRVFVFPNTGCC